MRWLAAFLVVIILGLAGWLGNSALQGNDGFSMRWPAAELRGTPSDVDLSLAFDHLRTELLGPKFTLPLCARVLDEASNHILDPRLMESETRSPGLVQQMFDVQLLVRLRMKEFGPDLVKNPTCPAALRRFFSRLRVLSDSVGEKDANLPEPDDDGRPTVLQGGRPYLLQNPAYESLNLRTGDLLLSRGVTFLTTAAARLYGAESNFSHIEMVYIDSAGAEWGVSQTVALGIYARPIKDYLKNPKVRVLVLRANDHVIAASAAEWMYKKAKTARQVGPDLSFDFDLFRDAFAQASANAFKLPLSSSRLNFHARGILESFGLKAESSFAPEDLEIDPRFDLVGEWRDLALTSPTRMRDAVLTAMLQWMDQDHYAFKEVARGGFKKVLVEHLPNWPIFSGWHGPTDELDVRAESTLKAFDETGEVLFSHLEDVCDQVKDTLGRWPTPTEMSDELERYRRDDLKVYEKYQKTHGYDPLAAKPDFHLLFRP